MNYNHVSAKAWLEKNQGDMIVCPHQPGKLTLSKSACSKRHLMGKQEDIHTPQKGIDPFQYAYARGLSLCRDCPIGKKLSTRQKQARA